MHKEGWFTDIGSGTNKGIALSVSVKQVLHEEQSKYQKIVIFER